MHGSAKRREARIGASCSCWTTLWRRSIRKRKRTQAAEMSLSAKEQRAKMVRDFVKGNKLCNKTEIQLRPLCYTIAPQLQQN